jgi:hypothetical protein
MKNISILAMAMLMGTASPGFAASAHIPGSVIRTLIADQGRWGGCMILIDQTLSDYGLDCPQRWVSLSCDGTFTTKDIAYRMFDSAQMAYALGKRVFLQVEDTKKHNGYCYASRVDVLD